MPVASGSAADDAACGCAAQPIGNRHGETAGQRERARQDDVAAALVKLAQAGVERRRYRGHVREPAKHDRADGGGTALQRGDMRFVLGGNEHADPLPERLRQHGGGA